MKTDQHVLCQHCGNNINIQAELDAANQPSEPEQIAKAITGLTVLDIMLLQKLLSIQGIEMILAIGDNDNEGQ